MFFDNPKQVFEFEDDNEAAYRATWDELANRSAVSIAYYEGKQWRTTYGIGRNRRTEKLEVNYNPDANDVRVVDNIMTPLVLRLAAQTYPAHIEVEVSPGERDATVESMILAQTHEELAGAMSDASGFLKSWRAANFGRVVMGDYGVGLCVEYGSATLDMSGREVQTQDMRLKTFAFPPTRLVLDPFQTSPDLRDHDWVTYKDVWTLSKARRVFGKAVEGIDERQCQTVGALAEFEIVLNGLTDGRMFSQFRSFSKTPGVLIRQTHCRDHSGRFSAMYITVDGGYRDGRRLVNDGDTKSPFGGPSQLPFTMLHAHRREGSPWSVGDVTLAIDDQNRTNLLASISIRHANKHGAFKWVADKRWADVEEIRNKLNNEVGGILIGQTDPTRKIEAPYVVQTPPPSPVLMEMIKQQREQAMDKVGRPAITSGVVTPRVPDRSYQVALELADQLGNVRVQEDMAAQQAFVEMLTGTAIGAVQAGSPSVLSYLTRCGFGADDFSILVQSDTIESGLRYVVRSSSARNRTHESRRSDLFMAFQNQAIDAMRLRKGLAELDTSLIEDDKVMSRESQKAAYGILAGQEWEPLMLGEQTPIFLDAFRRALFDPAAKADPETRARVNRAIQSQTAAWAQEQVASDPQVLVQREQAMMGADQQAMASDEEAAEAERPKTIDEIMGAVA